MNETMEMIGSAMRAEADTLRVISQNIANSETIAYRRQVPITRVQFDELLGSVDAQVGRQVELATAVDFTPSTLKSTGEPLNVALDGPGFFVLQSKDGATLTRRGDFRVATDGTLLSFSGLPVLGEAGAIQVGDGPMTISADGVVSIGGNQVDRLRIVNVGDSKKIDAVGDGTYRVDTQFVTEGDARPSVRQGFVETSNVIPTNEMIQLMETVRRFETEQKFARAYDGMLDKAISELGKL